MALDLFVASSFLNKDMAALMERFLRAAGHRITSHWIEHPGSEDTEELQRQACEDMRGVLAADAVVVVWPGRLGTASEIGGALATGRRVFVYNSKLDPQGFDPRQNVYFCHPFVKVVGLGEELLEELQKYEAYLYDMQQSCGVREGRNRRQGS